MTLGPEHGIHCEQRVRNAPVCSCRTKQTVKVPLTAYLDGKKTVVGEAVVDIDEDGFGINAFVTDPKMKRVLDANLVGGVSIGPFTAKET